MNHADASGTRALFAGVLLFLLIAASAAVVARPRQAAGAADPWPQLAATPVAPATPTPRLTPPALPTPRVGALPDGALPAGFTDAGLPYLGSLDAPITLNEYSDYLCPFCARHFRTSYPLLRDEYLATGKVRLIFHDFPIPALHPTAILGHRAARCVAEQGAEHFWALHDALFARQDAWSRLPDPTDFVGALAVELGVDGDLYAACMATDRALHAVEASMAAGAALDFDGTPSFRLERTADGYTFDIVGAQPMARFRAVLDAMLAGEAVPAAPTPAPPKLPYWASDGLAPDPDRPGFTLAGDPYKGSPDAALTIVEFSDFQCPACATHAVEVQPALDAALIETGKVRWIFKNLPLAMHPLAPAAAAAAECAGDQGRFWEMHDLLFARQATWAAASEIAASEIAASEIDAALADLAGELDLDVAAFSACTASRQALERVLPDLYDAQGVVATTPGFIFLDGATGAVYQGTRDADAFIGLVERFLETLAVQEKSS